MMAVLKGKVNEVAAMLEAIHAQEDRQAARDKAALVVEKLAAMRLSQAAGIVREDVEETLSYRAFPRKHWVRYGLDYMLERIMHEIRRRTRVVGNFPDGRSALMLVAAKLRTHLAYKAEHVVDLESEVILSAHIHSGDAGDAETIADSVMQAQMNLNALPARPQIEEVAADKGYHKAETLALLSDLDLRTYVPEPSRPHRRQWKNKPAEQQQAVQANRRRVKRDKGKKLQRLRSERVERSFAHVCDSGGARRSWLRGIGDVSKRYLMAAAAHNLSRLVLKLWGIGKPRALQGLCAILYLLYLAGLTIRKHAHTIRLRLQPIKALVAQITIDIRRVQMSIIQRAARGAGRGNFPPKPYTTINQMCAS